MGGKPVLRSRALCRATQNVPRAICSTCPSSVETRFFFLVRSSLCSLRRAVHVRLCNFPRWSDGLWRDYILRAKHSGERRVYIGGRFGDAVRKGKYNWWTRVNGRGVFRGSARSMRVGPRLFSSGGGSLFGVTGFLASRSWFLSGCLITINRHLQLIEGRHTTLRISKSCRFFIAYVWRSGLQKHFFNGSWKYKKFCKDISNSDAFLFIHCRIVINSNKINSEYIKILLNFVDFKMALLVSQVSE